MKPENRYYRITRIGLSMLGHWPYHNSRTKNTRRIFVFILLIVSIKNQIKELLDRTKREWDSLNEKEREILHVHSVKGKRYAMYFATAIYIILTIYMAAPFIPHIVNLVRPSNETRLHFHRPKNGFFSRERMHYYFRLLHMYTTIIMRGTVQMATGALVITASSHACGVYNVLGYKLQHIYDSYKSNNGGTLNEEFHSKLSATVKYHERAIQYIGLIESYYGICYVTQLVHNTLILCFLSLRFCELLRTSSNLGEMAMCVTHIICNLPIFFLLIYPSQRLSNSSEQNYYKLCSGYWYEAPPQIQKTMLFMLQGCAKPCRVTAIHLFTMSVETYAKIVQTSMSYFTILYSLR